MKKLKILIMAFVLTFVMSIQAFAYTAIITKQSVTKSGNIYTITLGVVVNDGVADVLDFNISSKYNSNVPDMVSIMSDLQNKLKAKWDEYAANKVVFDAQMLDTGISTLQTQTNTYINQ